MICSVYSPQGIFHKKYNQCFSIKYFTIMVRIQSNITLSVGLALHAFFLLGTSSPTIFADAQSVTYSTGSRGTDCATNPGGGYEPITTAEECQAAATNGGFDYSSDTSNLSNPGGCNLTWGTNFVSFNTDNNNESGEFSVPFCKFSKSTSSPTIIILFRCPRY